MYYGNRCVLLTTLHVDSDYKAAGIILMMYVAAIAAEFKDSFIVQVNEDKLLSS